MLAQPAHFLLAPHYYFGYEPPSPSQGLKLGSVDHASDYQLSKDNALASDIDMSRDAYSASRLR
jgi:hypothetical protein